MQPINAKRMTLAVLMAAAFTNAARGAAPGTSSTADPLASWNERSAKKAIVDFVANATKQGSPDFVPPAERIAVFDHDGTLWAEKPLPVQAFFALDRLMALAPQHPEWQTQEPFASLLKGDAKAALAGGERAVVQLLMATHAGMTTDEFARIVSDWIATARHPKTGRLFTEMVYQPMLELLAYLRASGFKTYIVSGGGIEFMRPWAERVYGIPPEQVIGSSIKTKFELRDGEPVLVRLPEVGFVDGGPAKPVAIQMNIGRHPIAAFGNSDIDVEMLQWTATGPGARLCVVVHHTDPVREWAYDRADVGGLERGLVEARARGWTVVDMKADWKRIFAFEKE
jgi:phosphoglycolate phosphatase-like HAD superfamily hydrolase